MFEFLANAYKFMRRAFYKTQDDKYNSVEKDLEQLKQIISVIYSLYVKKSKAKNTSQILADQQDLILTCEKSARKIEGKIARYCHDLYKEEEKESVVLLSQISELAKNIKKQVQDSSNTQLQADEKNMLMNILKYIDDLFEKIKRIIIEGDYIYHYEYRSQLEQMRKKYKPVDDVVKKYIRQFKKLGTSPELQKSFLEELTKIIQKTIPASKWSFSFRQSVSTGDLNCSGAASLFGALVEETQQISRIQKIEFACPIGHAMAVATLTDGTICYCDPRNGSFEDITGRIERPIWHFGRFTVYVITDPSPKTPFLLLPCISVKEGILLTHSTNMNQLIRCTDDEARKIFEHLKYTKTHVKATNTPVWWTSITEQMLMLTPTYRKERKKVEQEKLAFEALDNYIKAKPESLEMMFSKIDAIEQFLLYKQETVPSLGDKQLEERLSDYREKTKTTQHISWQAYADDVKDKCNMIRKRFGKAV